MMFKYLCLALTILLLNSGSVSAGIVNPHDTYVVIIEMNEFPPGFVSLPLGFINTKRFKSSMAEIGILSANINILNKIVTARDVEESLSWLETRIQKSSTILFYIGTHGRYLRNVLKWNDWFPKRWQALKPDRKILFVDTCHAGEFIADEKIKTSAGYALGAVAADELNWWGIEEEGLPILGSVWLHFFTKSLINHAADRNGNGYVSVEEAFVDSASKYQAYMKNTVFGVKEFVQLYRKIGHDPFKKKRYPNPVLYDNHADELDLYQIPK